MSVFKRGKVWWYEFVFEGQRIQQSSKSRTKQVAIDAERIKRNELAGRHNNIPVRHKPVNFRTAAKTWKEGNRAHWSDANIRIQTYSIKHLSERFGKMLLTDITVGEIGLYQYARQEAGASNRTINMEVSTLRMILKSNKLWRAIADDVHMLKENKNIGKAITPEHEKKLLAACKASASRSLFYAVVIYSNTGVRGAELRLARWSQMNFLKKEFTVGEAKTEGSEGRVIPLNQAAMKAFEDWRKLWPDAKPTGYIFPSEKLHYADADAFEKGVMTPYEIDLTKPLGSWKRAWKTAKKSAGVECRMHDLRHGFVSKLAETQTPDATIEALAGHLSAKMRQHYSHIRQESKRHAVALLDTLATQTVQ